jgi:hypothetical protein
MNSNPLRQRKTGGGKPFNLIRAQAQVRVTLVGCQSPETVLCQNVRTGEEEIVSEAACYGATCNSWRVADRKSPHSIVMRELLDAGATLATTRALFRKA